MNQEITENKVYIYIGGKQGTGGVNQLTNE